MVGVVEKEKGLIVLLIALVLCTSVVIVNPSIPEDRKTLFIKKDLDKVVGAYGRTKGETSPPTLLKTGENFLKWRFNPVSTVVLQLDTSVLNKDPNRFYLRLQLLMREGSSVRISVVKVLDTSPRAELRTSNLYQLPVNETVEVTLRVWRLVGTRNATITDNGYDRIEISCQTDTMLRGVTLSMFRYLYYTEGKRGTTLALNVWKTRFYLFLFILAIMVPFSTLLWWKRVKTND